MCRWLTGGYPAVRSEQNAFAFLSRFLLTTQISGSCVLHGNTSSQNKIALGGWKSPHERKWPPWPVVRLVSQSKRTPGCRKHKYETKNPRVGHLGTRFQQELELIRWLSYVCSSVVLIYLIPPSGSYHNRASHSFSLANAQTVWFGSECVARGKTPS